MIKIFSQSLLKFLLRKLKYNPFKLALLRTLRKEIFMEVMNSMQLKADNMTTRAVIRDS